MRFRQAVTWVKMHTSIIICLVLLYVSCLSRAEPQLILAHALWRHGDRNPTAVWPTDKYNGPETWPAGLGQLTIRGMKNHFKLGKMIRDRYVKQYDLVKGHYNFEDIHVRCTDYNRTLISGYSDLAGFYNNGVHGETIPNNTEIQWPGMWQPIPLHMVPKPEDSLLWPLSHCPTVSNLKENVIYKQKNWTDVVEQNKDFMKFVSEKTGIPNLGLANFYKANDPLFIESVYNDTHKWPSWVTEKIYKHIQNLTFIADKFLFHHPTIARLSGGNLLKEIILRMRHKIACLNDQSYPCHWYNQIKYYAYSAHDITIMALLETFRNAHEIVGGGLPKYAACILLELWKLDNGQFAVQVMYRESHDVMQFHPITRTIAGCPEDDFCPLDTFEARSKPFMPENWKQECGLASEPSAEKNCDSKSVLYIVIAALSVLSALLIVALCGLCCCRWRERSRIV